MVSLPAYPLLRSPAMITSTEVDSPAGLEVRDTPVYRAPLASCTSTDRMLRPVPKQSGADATKVTVSPIEELGV